MPLPETLLQLSVALPLLGAVAVPVIGLFCERTRNLVAALLVVAAFVCSLALLPTVTTGAVPMIRGAFGFGADWFAADLLAVFMALVSAGVGLVIIVYSWDYISHYPFRNEYFFVVTLFLGAMMGLVYAGNLLLIYLFWEITAFACWRLIGFFREDEQIRRANKAFLMTMFGSLVMLLGFFLLADQAGSFDLAAIRAALRGTTASHGAVLLILFGILAKSATLPLHTWLPDAGVAPTPVTALLHAAVLVKIGVYVFARLFLATFAVPEVWHLVVPILAGVSALVSAGAALVETDMKRIIAYSTVSQLGFIFLGLAIGNELGMAGGVLYILMHGIAKGGLFLCAGIVEHATHTKDITKMGGLLGGMPVTALAFLLCAFSVMGIPPFGGFFSKLMVVWGAVQAGHPLLALLFVAGGMMTILYLMRLFILLFLGERKTGPVHEGSPLMVASVAFLGFLSLASGVLIHVPSLYVQTAVQQMMEFLR